MTKRSPPRSSARGAGSAPAGARRPGAAAPPLALLATGLLFIPGASTGVSAQAEGGTLRGGAKWSVDDILLQESAGGFRISPDGRWVVWVRSKIDPDAGRRRSGLWLSRVADGESWPLTRGDASDRSPRWSPDGERIAFLSDRDVPGAQGERDDSGPQIWLLRLQGGEPWPVTTDLRGLRRFQWKGESSDTLVVAARERRSWLERRRKETEDDARVVEDTLETPPIRLWSVAAGRDGARGKPRRLTTNEDWIRAFAVAPDGRRAVTVNGVDLSFEFDAQNPPRTYLVDLSSGERREILADVGDERVIPDDLQWSPDGRGFYLSWRYSTHPVYRSATVTRVAYYHLDGGRLERIGLNWHRGLGQGFDAVEEGFVALLADGVRDRPARYRRSGDGWSRTWIEGRHATNLWGWGISKDATVIAYQHSTTERPPRPYVARISGGRIEEPKPIADLNPSLARKPMPRSEVVRWSGARGEEVEGILYYPLEFQEGRPHPLVLNIHGGPAGRDTDSWTQSWSDPLVLYNQKGAFVLQVNYHGSCCYGLEWVESIAGGSRYYDLPVADIEAGVDELIGRGLVHPDSVATQGWSNGAILSTALTVENPRRYKVSLAGAGDVEWISDWANVDFGAAFDNYYFGASPLEDPEHYLELSPYFRLERVRAPTLIFFGTEDRNVPPSQGWSHYRALQQVGQAEVRFVLFPGEPHGLRELSHQRRKVEEELAWLDRHLWGRDVDRRAVIKEGSPLSGLLARAEAARSDGLFGMRDSGALLPETVPGDALLPETRGLGVGRFEVTRAQWKAFDPEYEIPEGTANHPATGISFQEARRYVEWLSERTGVRWRLPTEAEARALARSAKGGVTLAWWAGYLPNPEDEAALRRRLGAVSTRGAGPPLLLPVGSYPGDASGEEPRVFDTSGNAAEWAVDAAGTGVVVGPSAAVVGDPRVRERETPPAYRGLRVVKEAR